MLPVMNNRTEKPVGSIADIRALVARNLIPTEALAREYGCSVSWVNRVLREHVPASRVVRGRLASAVAAVLESSEGEAGP